MQMTYGSIVHKNKTELQLESIWTLLLAMNKSEAQNLTANPTAIIREHLMSKFGLAPNSAYQTTLKAIKILADAGKIEPILGPKRSIAEIRLLDTKPILSLSNKNLAVSGARPKTNANNTGLNNELREMKEQLARLTQPQLPQSQPTAKGVAVWVDTPNFCNCCRNQGIKIPFVEMFETIRKNLGPIVFTGAFHNQNCGTGLLRIFKTFDFALFNCVSAKENYIEGYDPVDLEMDRVIRSLMNVADAHVIVSGDTDFNPLISFLRMNGKNANRFFVNSNDNGAILALKSKQIYVPCQQETNIALMQF